MSEVVLTSVIANASRDKGMNEGEDEKERSMGE